MSSQNDYKYQPSETSDFSGGINTSQPDTDIDNNQCVEILNHYFDKSNNLVTRFGCTKVNNSPSNFGNRITSLFGYAFGSVVTPAIILTSGSSVYSESLEDTFTDITGSAILPNDTFWHWKQFTDLVIGCNGSLSNSGYLNPVAWDGTGNIRQLKDGDNNAPSAKYAEVWNSRLFLVNADNPNLVYYSKLGDPENFTNGGGILSVDDGDGDGITGIFATKLNLFIFKRKCVYQLITGQVKTDDTQWSLDKYSKNTGCISQFTIQSFLDDALFLSDDGVIALSASIIEGKFESSFVSRFVPELTENIERIGVYNQFASVLNTSNSEYWLALPSKTSGSKNGVVWIFDYKEVKKGLIRWTKFDGLPVGVCYANISRDGKDRVYIGSDDGNLYYYDKEVKNDNGSSFTKTVVTKAFNYGTKVSRKELESIIINITNLTTASNDFSLTFSYNFDDDPLLTQSFTITKTEIISGSVWGETSPSIGTWALMSSSNLCANFRAFSQIGKRFNSIQFTITDSTLDRAYALDNIGLFLALITSRRVSKL